MVVSCYNKVTGKRKEPEMTATVKNFWGREFDADIAYHYMDEVVSENVWEEIAPCTDQEFFDAYCKAHEDKFDEEWELAKENPVF